MITAPDAVVCMACKLAKLQESGGIITVAVESGHSRCQHNGCICGCEFSTGQRCPDCRRYGMNIDGELGDDGHCVDKRDCAAAIVAEKQAEAAARAVRAAAAPERPSKRPSSAPRDCKCGCGEQTGGGFYRPGHDARHVSNLVSAVKAGSISLDHAIDEVDHSQKLMDKLRAAVEA